MSATRVFLRPRSRSEAGSGSVVGLILVVLVAALVILFLRGWQPGVEPRPWLKRLRAGAAELAAPDAGREERVEIEHPIGPRDVVAPTAPPPDIAAPTDVAVVPEELRAFLPEPDAQPAMPASPWSPEREALLQRAIATYREVLSDEVTPDGGDE